MTKIFIGGFPLDITELELVQLISWHGSVSTIKIVRDKKTRICKGYAFVEMEDRIGAENAVIALDGTMLQGRELTLNITEDQPVKKAPSPRPYTKPSAPADTADRPKRPRRLSS
ncbi:RNA-binding protein [Mucilaginibacter sp. RB4R14]|uniref:RNA recognition motif domain-containing protein n=1 Tax=Mucilaginibacter aurantiaciroseus TaxID=2949308 RepID=UPI0020908D74|nr:RNA-binding protein [Mucilaginibacter aurantiaciroseus]MCO5934942.1 RNA-binding protein [Mucilaginibacter aurantiaciroseus]